MDPSQTDGQPTVSDTISQDPTPSSSEKCTDPSSKLFSQNAQNSVKDSVFGIWCVCKDGYKNINDVCTPCSDPGVCCGISLNTSVPFIGSCIENSTTDVGAGEETSVTWDNAFPVLLWSLTKILVTVILIVSFVLIIVGGIMIATGDPSGGKWLIMKVVIGIALLWASGVILRLINPNFFG